MDGQCHFDHDYLLSLSKMSLLGVPGCTMEMFCCTDLAGIDPYYSLVVVGIAHKTCMSSLHSS